MGGKKHYYQEMGFIPPSKSDSIIERHFDFEHHVMTIHCRLCGRPIEAIDVNEHNQSVDYTYEMQMQAHTSCMKKDMEKRRRRE